MNKKYSMPTMAAAETLIMALATPNDDGSMPTCKQVTSTEGTHAIVCLGFQDEIIIDEETEEEVIVAGLTFDVDVIWKKKFDDEGIELIYDADWIQYEVSPEFPKHRFL